MRQDLDQKISLLIDNELDHEEALSLLANIKQQEKLSQTMARYEAISHSLKAESFLSADVGFVSRISQEIAKEPTYFLPQKKQPRFLQKSLLALAATVTAVAVLVGSGMDSGEVKFKSSLVVAEKTTEVDKINEKINQKPFNERFNEYLQAHNDSLYTNGEVAPLPYARLAGYGQE